MKRAWVRAVPRDGHNFWRVVVYVSGGGVLHSVLFATHTDALRYTHDAAHRLAAKENAWH